MTQRRPGAVAAGERGTRRGRGRGHGQGEEGDGVAEMVTSAVQPLGFPLRPAKFIVCRRKRTATLRGATRNDDGCKQNGRRRHRSDNKTVIGGQMIKRQTNMSETKMTVILYIIRVTQDTSKLAEVNWPKSSSVIVNVRRSPIEGTHPPMKEPSQSTAVDRIGARISFRSFTHVIDAGVRPLLNMPTDKGLL